MLVFVYRVSLAFVFGVEFVLLLIELYSFLFYYFFSFGIRY